MSTPTPRTDAAVTLTFAAGHNTVCPNFARTLERELAAAQGEVERLKKLNQQSCLEWADGILRDAAVQRSGKRELVKRGERAQAELAAAQGEMAELHERLEQAAKDESRLRNENTRLLEAILNAPSRIADALTARKEGT